MSKKDTPRGTTDRDLGVVPSEEFAEEDAAETHVWKGAEPRSGAARGGRPPPVPGRPPMDPGPPSSVFFAVDFEEEIATLARSGSTRGELPASSPARSETPSVAVSPSGKLASDAKDEASRGPVSAPEPSLPSPSPSLPPPAAAASLRPPLGGGSRPVSTPVRYRSKRPASVASSDPPSAAAIEPTETMALAEIEMAVGAPAAPEPLSSPPARFAKATAQTLGRSFAGFRIVRKIAEGGMASVFLGRKAGPRGFNQHAAVKVVHPHFADQRAFVEMFLDEARIAALVQHANVCRVLDFGHAHGTYFLAMEYVHGEPWAELQHALYGHPEGSSALPVIAAHVISLACEGLHAAHQAVDETGKSLHIVHRDVSPQNILVAFDGTVRVLDFGIASATDRLTTTRTGTVKGRLSYMAPEQMRADRVDARADVWSLGVVLREALEGRRLFRRQAEAATMLAVCSDPMPEWSEHVPEALRAVVDRALTRDRDERYASARDMAVALSEFVRSQDVAISSADLSGWLERLFAERIETKRAWLSEPIPEPLPDEPSDASTPVSLQPLVMQAADVPAPVPEAPPPAPLLPPVPELRAEPVDPAPAPVGLGEPRRRGKSVVLWVVALLFVGGALWVGSDRYTDDQLEQARRREAARFLRETANAPASTGQGSSQADVEETSPAAEVPADVAEPDRSGEPAAPPSEAERGPAAVAPAPQQAQSPSEGREGRAIRRRAEAPRAEPAPKRADEEAESPPPSEPGTLVVGFVGGWAEVYVNDTKLGTTPGRFELPSGRTRVVLKPFGAGPEIVRVVDVPAGAQRKLIVEP